MILLIDIDQSYTSLWNNVAKIYISFSVPQTSFFSNEFIFTYLLFVAEGLEITLVVVLVSDVMTRDMDR